MKQASKQHSKQTKLKNVQKRGDKHVGHRRGVPPPQND